MDGSRVAEDDVAVRRTALPTAREAALVRREIVDALFAAGGGHYGGSLSVVDVLLVLYRHVLAVSPRQPNHPDRDRLILSKGHACIALYAILRRLGFFDHDLGSYGRMASPLEGHPDMRLLPGIDFSTGSLGQGLSAGVGMAIASRKRFRTWVVLGDGECQEGQVWEAAMLAARLRTDGLHAVVDVNRFQEFGNGTQPLEDAAAKWRAFGWRVLEADGHDHEELAATFSQALETRSQPSVVLAHTVKGKGFGMTESDPARFHCTRLDAREHALLIETGR